jgi:hypothetical protein
MKFLILVAVLCLVACSPEAVVVDSGIDAGEMADAGADSGEDTASDANEDASVEDVGADAPSNG